MSSSTSSRPICLIIILECRSIGKDITSTYTKLEKLTLLAKRKTIFDDKPVEIQELTYIIKQDIAHLNKQIGQLQTIAKYVFISLNGFYRPIGPITLFYLKW